MLQYGKSYILQINEAPISSVVALLANSVGYKLERITIKLSQLRKHLLRLLKKRTKSIGHRVNFRDIFKKLTFEGYVKEGFGYHDNKYDVIKCLEGNLNIPVISQCMIRLSN